MPLYTIHLGPWLKSIDSELPITHCLVGRRDPGFQKPDDELIRRSMIVGAKLPVDHPDNMTVEQRFAVGRYHFNLDHGFYERKALTWALSVQHGEDAKTQFPAPEWDQDSLVLIPATDFKYG